MHLALISVRNVPLFAVICAAPLAAAAENALAEFDYGRTLKEAGGAQEGRRRGWGMVGAWALAVALLVAVAASPVMLGQGAGIPTEAIERLPNGRLFTTDQWADYLLYAKPNGKVFFDGRNDFYGSAFIESYLRVMRAEPGWEAVVQKYRVSVALVPTASSINVALSHNEAWMIACQDSKATAFFRRARFNGGRKR